MNPNGYLGDDFINNLHDLTLDSIQVAGKILAGKGVSESDVVESAVKALNGDRSLFTEMELDNLYLAVASQAVLMRVTDAKMIQLSNIQNSISTKDNHETKA